MLKAMREDGFITERQDQEAAAAPLKVTREEAESSDAPYFVDLVNETLQSRFQYATSRTLLIGYTPLST